MWCGVIPAADIRYAKSGKVSLAYQTFGAGDTDLVLAPGYISNLEANWEEPNYARFLEHRMREEWELEGTPVALQFRQSK